jgi:4-amino-4-deoxy-L-arabinose transferase-like glycosyltransferase
MSDARWAGLLFAAALLARVVVGMGSAIFGTDSGHYLLMADWFREGRFDEALAIAYHPMYPLLASVVRLLVGNTELAGSLVSMLLGAGAVLPLFWTVRDIFGRPTGVLTALLYSFHPTLVEIQSDVMTEATFMFFLFSAQWLTWRLMAAPSLDRAAVLGAAAAGAFLTRPEGMLAMAMALGWPLLALVRRRDALGTRLAGVALTLVVALLLTTPYLLWVKSFRGRWALSPRQSVISTEQEMGLSKKEPGDAQTPPPSHFYGVFAKSMLRLTLYGAWVPFMIAGLMTLRDPCPGKWFYFSLPLGHMAGILYALRTHPFMSLRYLLAPVALLGVLTAAGLVAAVAWLARRRPDAAWRPAAAAALVLALAVLPAAKLLQPRRLEYLSFPVAARRILEEGPRPRAMSGPAEQVAYLCGVRSFYGAQDHEGIRRQIDEHHVDVYVYSEKDLTGKEEYVRMLRSCPSLAAPVEVTGPPGTWKVYYQRSK